MCGIIGCVPKIDSDLFKKGIGAIAHRGPDGEGIWDDSNHNIMLGHRRLSILDLSEEGEQPMRFENLILTFNGEIYNYIEIRQELISKGYFFKSATDSEVLLKAYHCWGVESFSKFNGMWAIGIYDTNTHTLLVSRDRYGVKPLYYYVSGDQFIFASEVQAIHSILGNSHPLETEVVKTIVQGSFAWHGKEKTYLKDVSVLLPGSYIVLENNKVIRKRWYTLTKAAVPKKFEDQTERFLELLIDSCRIRLRSDVPVGTCLSGGLDSGSITAILNKTTLPASSSYTHRSFCAAFPGTTIDESKKAIRLADQLGSKLDIINIEAPSIEELTLSMRSCDGPMHALAFYPIWKLYQYIREQGIVVTLDGQGPDEMLGGYQPVSAAIRSAWKSNRLGRVWDMYKTYGNQGETPHYSSKKNAKRVVIETVKAGLIKTAGSIIGKKRERIALHPFSDDELDEELYRQFFIDPLPAILQQYDRCSMAHAVECRMPFMDYRLVEFAFSLEASAKVGSGFTKRILREAVRNILPDATRLDKQKIGFNAPIVDWFRGSLKGWMLDMMNSKNFTESAYFDGQYLKDAFARFLKTDNPQWSDAWAFWGSIHFTWWINEQRQR
jgi:asparagine synthase (glutamine-hydrolysing)